MRLHSEKLMPPSGMTVIDDREGRMGSALGVAWPKKERTSKPWTRWWWLGSAVDRENLTRELESLAAAGLGGVEITPIYGVRGAEGQFLEFLSEDYLEMLRHTGEEAARLGLGVDMATCTGWPFGGPGVAPEYADTQLRIEDNELLAEPTGMQVKRAAPGGAGLVVDGFSSEALGRYLEPFTRALDTLPPGLLRAQFHDSFEYSGNWSRDLPAKFEQMHGYSIEAHAAALSGEGGADTIGRVKSDYRETLSQMHLEYIEAWARWARERGMQTRNQAHGAPGNLLDIYAAADIPETEVFGSTPFPVPGLRREHDTIREDLDLPEPLINRFASSAAHVMGRPLVSSETFTWLRDHFKVALSQTKPELDQLFIEGINHVFYHGTAYSPESAPWPGWLFYASTQFNNRNTLWEDLPALNSYIQRVQSVLQTGLPDNDILLYWPIHDIWKDPDGLAQKLTVHSVGWIMETPFGLLAQRMEQEGYSFDYVSDLQLQSIQVADGALVSAGGAYKTLVVPGTDRMPVATLERILTMAHEGATVILEATPNDVPGLADLEQRRARFRALLEQLKFSSVSGGRAEAALGKGRVLLGNVTGALPMTGAIREPVAETGIGFVRRVRDDGHHYFLANLTEAIRGGWVELGVPARSVAIMNPLDGRIGVAPIRKTADGATEVYLQLEPGESLILWTRMTDLIEGKPWEWMQTGGAPIVLNGDWRLRFLRGGPELPDPVETRHLRSWTELAGEAGSRFSGTVRYRHEFELPEAAADMDEWLLDLTGVRESARVSINGIEAGTVWSLPFQLRVGDFLKPGINLLEIDVTNLAANRIRDLDLRRVKWKIMHEINFVDIHYKPFDASTWRVEPSGLVETPKLLPLKRVTATSR